MQNSGFFGDLAPYLDHSLLDPTATAAAVELCCHQAIHHGFAAVYVHPWAVSQAVDLLKNQKVAVGTVIGFPLGATTAATKLFEAQEATERGATELDVVINLGLLKGGKTEAVYEEIAQISQETGQKVKAILEMSRLTAAEKRLAAEICLDAGASFLKTHTGMFGGATVADVSFLAAITQGRVGVKAAGGIRSYEQAIALIEAGASRLGTSHSIDLLQQQKEMNA